MIPVVYNIYGAQLAFGIPGILMCAATIIFWLGRKKYVRLPPSGIKKENFISITGNAIRQIFSNRNGMGIWEATGKKFTVASIDGVKAVYNIIMVFSFMPIFWAMWDQNLAEWVLQAKKLDLTIFGYTPFAEQIQTFNLVFLISMIPIMTYLVYPLCEKLGFKVTPLRKIGEGLLLTALTFIIIALVQESVDNGGHPTV